jgi:hypothetical protein
LRLLGFAALLSISTVDAGWPQTAAPPQTQPPPPQQSAPANLQAPGSPAGDATSQPAAPENPGLFNEMGKVLEKSLSILPTLKSPSETLDDLNTKTKDAVKDAGESLSRLTTPASVAEGRIKCPAAANGASDCKAAADRLCQAKGFKEGKSLSTDSAEACSAKVLIPGRTRKPEDCHTDYFVKRALCQ